MKYALLGSAYFCLSIPSGVVAATIVYTGQQAQGDLVADYTVETDGTIGVLAAANITGFSFTITNGTSSASADETDGSKLVLGQALRATATSLLFFFEQPTPSVFQLSFGGTSNSPSYRVAFASSPPLAAINLKLYGEANTSYPGNEPRVIATVQAPVPEPATWAMMIGGFGIVGGSLRRSRRTTVAFG